jgi:two-component system chemotaxis sensor kinase CheA
LSSLREQLLAAFEIEHREHLEVIRRGLAAAARGVEYDIRDVFRRAHSLKGAARAVDLPAVEDLAHRLEAALARVQSGDLALDDDTLALLHRGVDAIEALAATPDGQARADLDTVAALSRLAGEAPPDPPATSPGNAEAIADAEAPAEAPVAYLRVAEEQVAQLSRSMHELNAELQRRDLLDDRLEEIAAAAAGLRRRSFGGKAADPALGSLLRDIAALWRDHRRARWSFGQAVRRLQQDVDAVALVPVGSIFGDFGRMIRDMARSDGREVTVFVEGTEVEADRDVLQRLKDPMLHLVRNALSHGAETAAEREARAKPARPEISLEFRSRGGRLFVTVRDDGRGPDLVRIQATAIERGLIARPRPGEAPPQADQLLSLVFHPGFSTAAAVDHLSGRGMGLSVVAEAVRLLHGTVRLRRARPWGAEVLISVPLQAARQPILLVESDGRFYGLPTHGVERLLRLPVSSIENAGERPAARIEIGGRDVMVPVVALQALVGSVNAEIPIEADIVKVALLRRGARRCAVAVAAFHDVRTLTVGEAAAIGLDPDLVSGIVLLDESVPAPVLDPEALVERWMRDEARLAATGLGLVATERTPEAATILVVDDSITTRTLQKSILEAQGYRVLLSVDGIDALQTLRSGETAVDLVVADVEMPRLDGFGLLQAIRNDARLAQIPVIMMTSRADAADVRRGLELGAGAYITKQKFDQRELLATIGQLL